MVAERYTDSMTTDAMWEAVLSRNQQAPFVYAVRSTGVYCRPSCSSRRPSRDVVEFFSRPDVAEDAGYRPCKRCRPGEIDGSVEMVEHTCRCIEETLETGLTLAELGKRVAVSPYHLHRTFKRVMGMTPREYADWCRLKRFKQNLKSGDSVTGALYEAGYGSASRLYERADSHLGMLPAAYKRGGEGAAVRYTILDCSLGRLLVAATNRGICFVSMGEGDAELEAGLRAELHSAELRRDDEGLGAWVSPIVDYLRGAEPHLDLPLDVRATAFQRRVWDELRAIPYGETRTYSQIAAALGQPSAARAVGHACATNPVSLVVPCHRVVRRDGNLGGYRWGLSRKQELLQREGAASQG